MPTFQGQVNEEQILALIAYIESLRVPDSRPRRRPRPARPRGRQPAEQPADDEPAPDASCRPLPEERLGPPSPGCSRRTTSGSASCTWCRSRSMFAIGSLYAGIVRWNLLVPDGSHMSAETYNKLVHRARRRDGVLLPDPVDPGDARELPVPLMIGAKDLAFPRSTCSPGTSTWSGRVAHAVRALDGRPRHGLDLLHALQHGLRQQQRRRGRGRHLHRRLLLDPHRPQLHRDDPQDARARAHLVPAAALRLGALRHVASSRCWARRWWRSRSCWWRSSGCFHFGFFDPSRGGDPILFQHLFWFYSHPAVYIMILPSMGVISEIVTCFSRKRDLRLQLHRHVEPGDRRARLPGLGAPHVRHRAVGLLGDGLLGAHLPGRDPVGDQGLQLDRDALPRLGVSGTRRCSTCSASSACSLIGGLTGLFLATLGLDVHLTDTYFIVAHFHYIMVGGTIMGYLGGLHFWWPKITGRLYPEAWAQVSRARWSSSAST